MPIRIPPGGPVIAPTLPTTPGPTLPSVPTAPSVPTTPVVRPDGWGPGRRPVWVKPTYDISIPDNLGRPPRTTDVTIRTGFDGRSPDQVVGFVKQKLKGALHPSNRRFVEQSVRENHKHFTVAVSNMFVAGSPPNRFVANLAARNTVTVLCTMSALNPVIIKAEAPGLPTPRYFARGPNGDYQPIPEPKYPVIIESKLRFRPEPGLTVEYPRWSAPVLAGPTTTITEL